MLDKLTVAESWWSGPVNEFLSATVSLSSTNCGPRRHQSSSLYERPSEQGLEWALKPPLQTLYGLGLGLGLLSRKDREAANPTDTPRKNTGNSQRAHGNQTYPKRRQKVLQTGPGCHTAETCCCCCLFTPYPVTKQRTLPRKSRSLRALVVRRTSIHTITVWK